MKDKEVVTTGVSNFEEKIRVDFIENGLTMVQIGEKNKLSRERIRQILQTKFNVTSKDGKVRELNNIKRADVKVRSDARFLEHYGMTREAYKAIKLLNSVKKNGKVCNTAYAAYINKKSNAARLKVPFELNFGQWWKLWTDSGLLAERGQGKCGLIRKDSSLGFTVENSFVGLSSRQASVKMIAWWVGQGHYNVTAGESKPLSDREAAQLFFEFHGMSESRFYEIKAQTSIIKNGKTYDSAYKAYFKQKSLAIKAGIVFELNFSQWWELWEESGLFANSSEEKHELVCKDAELGFIFGNCVIDKVKSSSHLAV